MTINPLSPIDGFPPLGGSNQLGKPRSSSTPATETADFASVLSDLAKQTANNLKASEETAVKGVQGQAPVQEVVQSVMQAQTSLQVALALRDKAITAYQSIIQMPI
jgi:flagellar hook-basal body complex protein FliE